MLREIYRQFREAHVGSRCHGCHRTVSSVVSLPPESGSGKAARGYIFCAPCCPLPDWDGRCDDLELQCESYVAGSVDRGSTVFIHVTDSAIVLFLYFYFQRYNLLADLGMYSTDATKFWRGSEHLSDSFSSVCVIDTSSDYTVCECCSYSDDSDKDIESL